MKATSISTLLACLVMGVSLNAGAADQSRTETQTQTQVNAKKQDVIYGSQLMTYKERRAYQAKMRSLKTTEEREALRRNTTRKCKRGPGRWARPCRTNLRPKAWVWAEGWGRAAAWVPAWGQVVAWARLVPD